MRSIIPSFVLICTSFLAYAAPVVEFVPFEASAALIANPLLIEGPLGIASRAEGGHFGWQIEDNKTFYLAIQWASVEAHINFTTTPEYAQVPALMAPLVVGTPTAHHIAFHRDPTVAFGAHITEIRVAKLNKGKSRRDLEDAVDELKRIADKVPGIHAPGSVGDADESPGTFYILVGWDTVEQHLAALQSDSNEIKPFFQKVQDALAPGASMVHANFRRF